MNVLVEYDGRKRLVNALGPESVLKTACESFLLRDMQLMTEIWNDHFKEWVEMNCLEDIVDNSKIRLKPILPPTDHPRAQLSASGSGVEVTNVSQRSTIPVMELSAGSPGSSTRPSPGASGSGVEGTNVSQRSTIPVMELSAGSPGSSTRPSPGTSSCGHESVWRTVCSNLSTSCRAAVEGDRPLSAQEWIELINCWYNEVGEGCLYPKGQKYLAWATELMDVGGLSVRSSDSLMASIDFVRSKLKMKMKNERYKLSKSADSKQTSVTRKRKLESMGLTNYEPESKRVKEQDVEKVYRLKNRWTSMSQEEREQYKMDTFNERRRIVFSAKGNLMEQLQFACPWLLDENEIWLELEHICGGIRREAATRAMDSIIKAVKAKFLMETDVDACKALLHLFGVQMSHLESSTVSIRGDETGATLLVCGKEVCRTTGGWSGALLLWAAAHTVFAVTPKLGLGNLLLVLQERCLDVREKKLPEKATKTLAFILDEKTPAMGHTGVGSSTTCSAVTRRVRQ